MRRIVIRLHELREVLWPLGLLFRGQGSKQIMQRAIEPLALRVATGVVWSGPGFLDAIELTQGFHQLRLKVPTLVTVDFLGYPIALEPLVGQHLGTVPASWLRVGMAWVNFEKTSVRTRKFSRPSLAVASFVKSIAKISRGRLASR